MELNIKTNKAKQVVDLTEDIQKHISKEAKLVNVFVAHTTCAITCADLDPGTDEDLLDAVWEMIPKLNYRHPHNPEHVPAHLASSIIGPGVSLPVHDGKLILGTWQRIILVELDGPRERKIVISEL